MSATPGAASARIPGSPAAARDPPGQRCPSRLVPFAVSGSIVEADATLNFKLLSSESALNAAVPPGNVEQQGLTASGRDSEVSPAAARRPRGRRCGARAVVVRTLSAARARGRFSEPVTFHSDRQPERPTGY
jgi:hypothetical protein